MAKGKVPPSFLKNMKGAKGSPVGKGDAVTDPKGKSGTVVGKSGGMVKVRHSDGSTDTHPAAAVKKKASRKVGRKTK